MLASLQGWNPSIPMNAPALRAATGARGKFFWTEEVEEEYQNVRQKLRKPLKLILYNPKQKLRLVIYGAWTAGTGFLRILYIDDKDIDKGFKIIHSGSNLLPLDRDFSSMEAETITLDHAISACYHWIYYCP